MVLLLQAATLSPKNSRLHWVKPDGTKELRLHFDNSAARLASARAGMRASRMKGGAFDYFE